MNRLVAVVLAVYGFRLSKHSTETIQRLQAEAAHGDPVAAAHFTANALRESARTAQ